MDSQRIIQFPKISDPRGNLSFVQYPNHVPFEIGRVFWTYDIPSNSYRGGHSFKNQLEVIIALSGSFDVIITNFDGSKDIHKLNCPNFGLFLPVLTWRHIENFSTNSLALHLSDMPYDEKDYLRDFEDYKKKIKNVYGF